MKLSPEQVRRVEENIEGHAVPEGHAAAPQLETVFGRHTFFLDDQGLSIVERSPLDEHVGNLVSVASWTNEKRTMLEPHDPEPTAVMVELGSERMDGARTDDEY
ncbi:MAG TPA: hypothetical protein VMQ73_24100 [Methylomirabilota bacterium]|nr:hypothetical protein [Methylomirabilota bacterium]